MSCIDPSLSTDLLPPSSPSPREPGVHHHRPRTAHRHTFTYGASPCRVGGEHVLLLLLLLHSSPKMGLLGHV
jgi:hypothetical protein